MIHDELTEGFTFPLQYMQHGCNTYIAKEMKKHCKKAVIETIGGINEPQMADLLIAEGGADLVGMSRSFIADPDWAEKVRCGREDEIRPCIRCLRCLNYSTIPGSGTGTSMCTVNPRRVFPHPLPPSYLLQPNKKVVVIGGGPAGMKAAVELSRKGHRVSIFEKAGTLGGRLYFSDYMEFKEDIRRYRDYLIRLVEKDEKITVYLNTEATRERIEQEAPDAVIVAIGAEPFVPPIEGREKANVIHSAEVFGMESQLGETVAIVGGGQVGCELAVHLKQFCKKIELIEAGEELMPDGYDTPEERYWTIFCMEHDFERSGRESASAPLSDKVTIRLNSKCVSIDDQGLSIVDAAGERQHIKADKVIMATGLKPDAEKKKIFKNTAYDVIYIGDCEKVGNILGTSSSAYRASFRI
ncbi:MAG: FAD-dependent oxidoreductase [Firmicutes bacterium]|nr:FAD-dependent oxidoreductase [Bacillota bacterium]